MNKIKKFKLVLEFQAELAEPKAENFFTLFGNAALSKTFLNAFFKNKKALERHYK